VCGRCVGGVVFEGPLVVYATSSEYSAVEVTTMRLGRRRLEGRAEKQTSGRDLGHTGTLRGTAGVSSSQRKSSLGLFRPGRPDRDAPRLSCLPCSVAPAATWGGQVTSWLSRKPKMSVPRVNQRARRLHTHSACGVGKEKRARAGRQRRGQGRIERAVACKRAISGLDGLATLDKLFGSLV